MTIRDWNDLTQDERDVMIDRLLADLAEPPRPVCRFGQGDYATDYTPPAGFVSGWTVAAFAFVAVAAVVGFALFLGAMP